MSDDFFEIHLHFEDGREHIFKSASVGDLYLETLNGVRYVFEPRESANLVIDDVINGRTALGVIDMDEKVEHRKLSEIK